MNWLDDLPVSVYLAVCAGLALAGGLLAWATGLRWEISL